MPWQHSKAEIQTRGWHLSPGFKPKEGSASRKRAGGVQKANQAGPGGMNSMGWPKAWCPQSGQSKQGALGKELGAAQRDKSRSSSHAKWPAGLSYSGSELLSTGRTSWPSEELLNTHIHVQIHIHVILCLEPTAIISVRMRDGAGADVLLTPLWILMCSQAETSRIETLTLASVRRQWAGPRLVTGGPGRMGTSLCGLPQQNATAWGANPDAYSPTLLETRSPRSRGRQLWSLLKLCPQHADGCLLTVSSMVAPVYFVCVLMSSSFKDTSHIGLEPT